MQFSSYTFKSSLAISIIGALLHQTKFLCPYCFFHAQLILLCFAVGYLLKNSSQSVSISKMLDFPDQIGNILPVEVIGNIKDKLEHL